MNKKYKNKVSTTFLYSLAIISIIGFLAIVGDTWFQFDFLTNNSSALILVVLGGGLIVESNIRRIKSMLKSGLNGSEITHIVTGVVGILAMIAGASALFGIEALALESMKGIVASLAVILIVIQTWLVK